jgi:hypothetical protein
MAGGNTGDGGTGSSQAAGGSFGGAFESSDFEGSCRYWDADDAFRCVEFYAFPEVTGHCGLPVYGTTAESTNEPCPHDDLIGVCIEHDRIWYHYEGGTTDAELLEESCKSRGTFVRP